MNISNLTQWITNISQLFQPICINKSFDIEKIYLCSHQDNDESDLALVLLHDKDIILPSLLSQQHTELYSTDQEKCSFGELKTTLEISINLCRVCLYRYGDRLAPILFIEHGELISNDNNMDNISPFSTLKDWITLPEICHWLSNWEMLDQDTFLSRVYSGDYFFNYYLSIEPMLECMLLSCTDNNDNIDNNNNSNNNNNYNKYNKLENQTIQSRSSSSLSFQKQKSTSSFSSMDTSFETVYHINSPLPIGRWTNSYAQELFNNANEDIMDGYIIALPETMKEEEKKKKKINHYITNPPLNEKLKKNENKEWMEIESIHSLSTQPLNSLNHHNNDNVNDNDNTQEWFHSFLQLHTSSSDDYHRFLNLSNARMTKWINDAHLIIDN